MQGIPVIFSPLRHFDPELVSGGRIQIIDPIFVNKITLKLL